MEFFSSAITWSDLAKSIGEAIDRLERASPKLTGQSLLIEVGEDFRSIRVSSFGGGHTQVLMRLGTLSETTGQTREDGLMAPHGSIDRAVSKAAADMLSWTKDPETLELIEHQRFSLLLRWPQGQTYPVNPYAYGLWDE